jgi:glycerophosphoryl diester phosphodiesterase
MPFGRTRGSRLPAHVASHRIDAINVYHRFCRPELIRLAHDHGLKIFAWGVRRPGAVERMRSRQVDGVYCDDVESMVRVLGL